MMASEAVDRQTAKLAREVEREIQFIVPLEL